MTLIHDSRVNGIVSSWCIGYQVRGGCITASVAKGYVRLDSGGPPVLRYWVNGSGALRFLEESPRVDRPMPAVPS